MPCLCGSLSCNSCGPAQGADPGWEAEYDRLMATKQGLALLEGLHRDTGCVYNDSKAKLDRDAAIREGGTR